MQDRRQAARVKQFNVYARPELPQFLAAVGTTAGTRPNPITAFTLRMNDIRLPTLCLSPHQSPFQRRPTTSTAIHEALDFREFYSKAVRRLCRSYGSRPIVCRRLCTPTAGERLSIDCKSIGRRPGCSIVCQRECRPHAPSTIQRDRRGSMNVLRVLSSQLDGTSIADCSSQCSTPNAARSIVKNTSVLSTVPWNSGAPRPKAESGISPPVCTAWSPGT